MIEGKITAGDIMSELKDIGSNGLKGGMKAGELCDFFRKFWGDNLVGFGVLDEQGRRLNIKSIELYRDLDHGFPVIEVQLGKEEEMAE